MRAFRYAFDGIAYIVRTQRNARIELGIAVAVVAAAAWLGVSALEWALIALTITLVLALEWINTVVELAVTLASPERHPLAKAAKDSAAAAVLIAALGAIAVGTLVLGPRLVARVFGP